MDLYNITIEDKVVEEVSLEELLAEINNYLYYGSDTNPTISNIIIEKINTK